MNRRRFIAAAALAALCPGLAAGRDAQGIPVAIFHKVSDTPRYPEDISAADLLEVFATLWGSGFHPVNLGDIVHGRVDAVVPAGGRAIGITVDDSHPSAIYNRRENPLAQCGASFLELYLRSAAEHRVQPRASFFLTREVDDRVAGLEGYFANPGFADDLAAIRERLPGVEFGYHTARHVLLKYRTGEETRAILAEQMEEFRTLGIFDLVEPILAYPYGLPANEEGIAAIRGLGFAAAASAYPGLHEGKRGEAPLCAYGEGLQGDPYRIPRINLGGAIYDAQFRFRSSSPLRKLFESFILRDNLYRRPA